MVYSSRLSTTSSSPLFINSCMYNNQHVHQHHQQFHKSSLTSLLHRIPQKALLLTLAILCVVWIGGGGVSTLPGNIITHGLASSSLHTASCTDTTYFFPSTILLNPDTDANTTLYIQRCTYQSGITISSSASGTPITGVVVVLEDVEASSVTVDSSISLQDGSITIRRLVVQTHLTVAAAVGEGGEVFVVDSVVGEAINIHSNFLSNSGLLLDNVTAASIEYGASSSSPATITGPGTTITFVDITVSGACDMYLAAVTSAGVVFQRASMKSLYVSGAFTAGASLLIDRSHVVDEPSSSTDVAFNNMATFSDSLFQMRRTTITTVGRMGMFVGGAFSSSSVHRLEDNLILNKWSETGTTAVVTIGAIVYANPFPTGTILEIRRNTIIFSQGSQSVGYALSVSTTGGQIVHEASNQYTGGHVLLSHLSSTSTDCIFIVDGATDMGSIVVQHSSTAGTLSDDQITLLNIAFATTISIATEYMIRANITIINVTVSAMSLTSTSLTSTNVFMNGVVVTNAFNFAPVSTTSSCIHLETITLPASVTSYVSPGTTTTTSIALVDVTALGGIAMNHAGQTSSTTLIQGGTMGYLNIYMAATATLHSIVVKGATLYGINIVSSDGASFTDSYIAIVDTYITYALKTQLYATVNSEVLYSGVDCETIVYSSGSSSSVDSRFLMADSSTHDSAAHTTISLTLGSAAGTSTNSSCVLLRNTLRNVVLLGAYTAASSLLIDQTSISGSNPDISIALNNSAHFTNALFEMRGSTATSLGSFVVYNVYSTDSGAVYRFTNNSLQMLAGSIRGDGPIYQCALCFSSDSYLNTGSVVEVLDTILTGSHALGHTLYVQLAGGVLAHNGSNTHSTGRITIYFETDTDGAYFVLANSYSMKWLEIKKNSAVQINNSFFGFYNVSAESLPWFASYSSNTTFEVQSSIFTGQVSFMCSSGYLLDTTIIVKDVYAEMLTFQDSSGFNTSTSNVTLDNVTLQYSVIVGVGSNFDGYIMVSRVEAKQFSISGAVIGGGMYFGSIFVNYTDIYAPAFSVDATFKDSTFEMTQSTIVSSSFTAIKHTTAALSGGTFRYIDNIISALQEVVTEAGYVGGIIFPLSGGFADGSRVEMIRNTISVTADRTNSFGLVLFTFGGTTYHDGTNRYIGGGIFFAPRTDTADIYFVVNASTLHASQPVRFVGNNGFTMSNVTVAIIDVVTNRIQMTSGTAVNATVLISNCTTSNYLSLSTDFTEGSTVTVNNATFGTLQLGSTVVDSIVSFTNIVCAGSVYVYCIQEGTTSFTFENSTYTDEFELGGEIKGTSSTLLNNNQFAVLFLDGSLDVGASIGITNNRFEFVTPNGWGMLYLDGIPHSGSLTIVSNNFVMDGLSAKCIVSSGVAGHLAIWGNNCTGTGGIEIILDAASSYVQIVGNMVESDIDVSGTNAPTVPGNRVAACNTDLASLPKTLVAGSNKPTEESCSPVTTVLVCGTTSTDVTQDTVAPCIAPTRDPSDEAEVLSRASSVIDSVTVSSSDVVDVDTSLAFLFISSQVVALYDADTAAYMIIDDYPTSYYTPSDACNIQQISSYLVEVDSAYNVPVVSKTMTLERTFTPPNTTTTTTTTTTTATTTAPIFVQTYFGYGTYKTRYPVHTPTSLSGIISGLPLLFSSTFQTLSAVRFVVKDTFSPTLRIGIDVVAGTTYTYMLGVTKTSTSSQYDGITIGSSTCTKFISPSTGLSDTVMSSSSLDCGILLTCPSMVQTPAVGNSFTDSITIAANSIAFTPTCSGVSVRMSGLVYSSAPMTQAAFYSYGLVSSSTSHANIDSSAAATSFKSLPDQWLGSSTASGVTGVSSTSTIYLVGNPSDPTSTSSTAPLSQRYFAPIAVSGASSTSLTSTGGTSVFCAIPDQTAYAATFIGSGSPISNSGSPTSCFTFDSIDALQIACDAESTCVGFSTVRVYLRELPMCMYLSGSDANPTTYSYDRIYYKRPTTLRTCTVGVERSGRVAVYVQQTSFGTAQAVVRVGGAVQAVCGGSSSFANGFVGKSGRCQLYALCFAGSVSSGASITVETQGSTISPNGCNNTMAVLVSQVTVDSVQVAATTAAPIEAVVMAGASNRSVATPSTASDTRSIPLFVYSAMSAALDVAQTGFDCTLGGCTTSPISVRTPGSCQVCGGTTGFFRSNRAGLSDRCDTGMYCGSNISLRGGASATTAACTAASSVTQSTPFTGFINISVDTSVLRMRTTVCSGFNATIYVSPTSTTVPVFPLVGDTTGTFRTLLTAPSTLSSAAAVTYAADRAGLSSSTLVPLLVTGPYGSQVHAIYAPSLGTTPQTTLSVNTTMTCIVDHTAAAIAKCSFPVPQGSTKVRVSVAQNDFSIDANQLTISILSGTSVHTSLNCGGSAKFGLQSGAQGQCNDFRTCTDRYLYTNDALALTATDGILTVLIPTSIRPRGCNFTASIITEFYTPVAEAVAFTCSAFECDGERKCIPYISVCDYVQDCSSNQDEDWCSPWHAIEQDYAFCVDSQYTANFTGSTYTDCRRLAAINTSSAFVLIGSTCNVYSSTISAELLASPATYLCPVTGAIPYVRLPTGTTLSLCTATFSCSGHGVIVGSTNTTGLCTCLCDDGFTGNDCSSRLKLDDITAIVLSLAATPNTSQLINRAAIAEVLVMNLSSSVSVLCDTLVPSVVSSTSLIIECVTSSVEGIPSVAYVHNRKLLTSESKALVNADLSYLGLPLVSAVTARTVMEPLITMTQCDEDTNTTSASCSNLRAFTMVRVKALAATALTSTSITVTSGSASSSSRVSRRDVECTPAASDEGGGCIVSYCDVQITAPTDSNITILNAVYADPDVTTGDCTSAGISLLAQERYGDITTTTNQTVSNVEADYEWYLVGAIIVFVVGSVLSTGVGCVLAFIHIRRLRTFLKASTPSPKTMTIIERFKATLAARLAFFQSMTAGKRLRPDRWAVIFITFAMLCTVATMFLGVYYYTAYARDSNFSVMYEEYTDSLCSASPTASMPRRIFSVQSSSTECSKMSITGEAVGLLYADGLCTGSDGAYTATLRTGGSFLQCMSNTEITKSSGSCIKVSELNSADDREIYVQLSCSTASQISERTMTIATLTTQPDTFIYSNLTELRSDLAFASLSAPPTTITSTGATVFQFPFLAGRVVQTSSSTSTMTVASTATKSEFDGVYDAARIVIQSFPGSFTLGDQSDAFAGYETSTVPFMADLSGTASADILAMMPNDGDYAVGYTFGGFGTSSEVTWQGAGPLAQRYYDIRGTVFDVAHHLPDSIESMGDGEGFSISMFLRLSSSTRGFAFAVTDAFENTQSGTVYTLDRLAEMIDNGQASSSWFDTTYKVYSSLYINGPGKMLTFAHADSQYVNRVEQIEWDLDSLDLTHVLNGLWHHVAVVYRVENSQLRATLVVDGVTSYASDGWSQCATRIPPLVQNFTETAPLYDITTDKVTDGGVLVVGYFNGGVYGLTVTPSEVINTDYLATGTTAMRSHNAFPRTKTLALGSVLLALGIAALLFVAIGGTIQVRGMIHASSSSKSRAIMREFLELQKQATLSPNLFGEPVGEPLTPIRLSTALRWSRLSLMQFSSLPGELTAQTRNPGENLLLILFNAHHRDLTRTSFTAEEWNTAVTKDREEREAARRCFCLPVMSDAKKDSKLLLGGSDIFMMEMYATNTALTNNQTESGFYSDSEEDAARDEGIEDVDHKGGGDGVGEVTNIQFSSGSSGGGGGSESGVLKSLTEVLAPMIVVFQSMYVWSTSIEFPSLYDDYFSDIFSFVSVDVSMTFSGIGSMVTPLVQLGCGFAFVALVIYFIFEDHLRFERSLARYVWRRDTIEYPPPPPPSLSLDADLDHTTANKGDAGDEDNKALPQSLQDRLPITVIEALEDPTIPEPFVELVTLPIPECRKLDLISKRIKNVYEADQNDYANMKKINVTSIDGAIYTIQRGDENLKDLSVVETTTPKYIRNNDNEGGVGCFNNERADDQHGGDTGSVAAAPPPPHTELRRLGCHCWRHPDVQLTPVEQSDIFPFSNPSTCCAVVNGQLCGVQVGKMFSCGEMSTNNNGVDVVCNFGLCEAHCRRTLKEMVLEKVYGGRRILHTNGYRWLFTIFILFAVNTMYTPFLKTALMILACHPQYQCEFDHCWNYVTQKFALAVFLSGSVVLVLGIGFPALLFVQLYRRRAALNIAFFATEYNDRYVSPESRGAEHKVLSTAEWLRFGAADNSALAQQYGDSSYRWLFLPAVALVFKVAVLIPAVFLEPRSWEQRLGSAIVEVLIAIFYFVTNTQLSPILLVTLRVSSVHQLLVLGLQNIDLVTQFDYALSISTALIAVTMSYVIFSGLVFLFTVALPLYVTRSDTGHIRRFLNDHGFDFSAGISLYLDPSVPSAKEVAAGADFQHVSSMAHLDFCEVHTISEGAFSGGGAHPSSTTFSAASGGGIIPRRFSEAVRRRRRRSSYAGGADANQLGALSAMPSHQQVFHPEDDFHRVGSTTPSQHRDEMVDGVLLQIGSLAYSTEVDNDYDYEMTDHNQQSAPTTTTSSTRRKSGFPHAPHSTSAEPRSTTTTASGASLEPVVPITPSSQVSPSWSPPLAAAHPHSHPRRSILSPSTERLENNRSSTAPTSQPRWGVAYINNDNHLRRRSTISSMPPQLDVPEFQQ